MTGTPIPRYAVIGNPIEHCRPPAIHHAVARQCGIELHHDRLLAPLDAFAATVSRYFAQGGCGLNVTVPFKEEAFQLAREALSPRTEVAAAVNMLWIKDGRVLGCITVGDGLLAVLCR